MNQEQLTSAIRQILLFAGGFVVAKGWIDNETLAVLAGAIATAAASIWAFKTRTKKSIVESAAAKVPVSVESQREAGITVPVAPKT
jgi:hypothetical protein